jgi:hypothetical protein
VESFGLRQVAPALWLHDTVQNRTEQSTSLTLTYSGLCRHFAPCPSGPWLFPLAPGPLTGSLWLPLAPPPSHFTGPLTILSAVAAFTGICAANSPQRCSTVAICRRHHHLHGTFPLAPILPHPILLAILHFSPSTLSLPSSHRFPFTSLRLLNLLLFHLPPLNLHILRA